MKRPHTASSSRIVSVELIERRIYLIRGEKVILDADLAELYQTSTKSLNLAVRRNSMRFPADFMFQLSKEETDCLRFQIETSKPGRGGRRYFPYAFTEQGIAMLSSVLKSDRAILVNVSIMRTFVKLRQIMTTHKGLAQRIDALERRYAKHDRHIGVIFDAIKKLLEPSVPPKRRIGFTNE